MAVRFQPENATYTNDHDEIYYDYDWEVYVVPSSIESESADKKNQH